MKKKTFLEPATLLPFWLAAATLIVVVIHNFIYAIFRIEEAVLFITALMLTLIFAVSVIYNVLTYINKGEPKDVWKMGWLGLIGILGVFAPPLIFFYGFFAFFGLKK
jgi:hypothetical protein